MEYLKLIGVAVVIVGFVLRWRVTGVVLAAGIVTGLVAKMSIVGTQDVPGIVDTLGKAFADNRIVTLFVLALPAIGLSERYGLQEQARRLILKFRAATVGRLQIVYQLFRILVVGLGIRLGSGHVAFSRPLVVPMAMGAAKLEEDRDRDRPETDVVKAACGASENYGNFYGQNLFFGAAGVGYVVNTLKDHGISVGAPRVALWAIPIAIVSVLLGAAQFLLLDRWLARRAKKDE